MPRKVAVAAGISAVSGKVRPGSLPDGPAASRPAYSALTVRRVAP